MITAEQEEALKAHAMTLEHLDGLWVLADDYIASEAARIEAEAATALVMERCAGARGLWLQFNSEGEPNGGYCTVEPHDPGDMKFYVSRDAIRSLAHIDGVALLVELRAKADAGVFWAEKASKTTIRLAGVKADRDSHKVRAETAIAERDALAARLERLREVLIDAVEIVHKSYVAATMEAVNAGPSHPLIKNYDAWRVRCMNAETKARAALSEDKPAGETEGTVAWGGAEGKPAP